MAHELSPDARYLAVAHYEGGQALRPRLRVYDLRTRKPAELNDKPVDLHDWQGRQDIALRSLGFPPSSSRPSSSRTYPEITPVDVS